MKKNDRYLLRVLLIFICFFSVALSFGKNLFSISTKDLKASTQQKNKGYIQLSRKKSIEVAKVELPLNDKENASALNLAVDSGYFYISSKTVSSTNKKTDKNSLITHITRCNKANCNDTKTYLAFSNSGSGKQFDKFVSNGKNYFFLASDAYNNLMNGKYYPVAKKYYTLNLDYLYSTSNTSINQDWTTFANSKARVENWSRFNLSKKGKINNPGESSLISIDDKNGRLALSNGNNISIYSINMSNIKTDKEIYKFNLTSSPKPKHKTSNAFKSIQDILLVGDYLYVLYSNRLDTSSPNTGTSYIYTYDIKTGNLIEDNILKLNNMQASKMGFNSLAYYDGNIYYSASYYSDNKIMNKIYKITSDIIDESSDITMYTGNKKNLNIIAPKGTATWEIKRGKNIIKQDFAKYGELYAVNEGTAIIVAKNKNGKLLKQFNITIKPTKITLIVGDSRTDDLEKMLRNSSTNLQKKQISSSKIHVGKISTYNILTNVFEFKDSKYPKNTIYTVSMRGATYKWMGEIFNNNFNKSDSVLKDAIDSIINSSSWYKKNVNIVFNIGVNSLNRKDYSLNKIEEILEYRKIKKYIEQKNKNTNIDFKYHYLSINPIDETLLNDCVGEGNNIRTNAKINEFNKKLIHYSKIDGYKYCDINSKIQFSYNKPSYCPYGDGLHYDSKTNQQIFDYIMTDCIGK